MRPDLRDTPVVGVDGELMLVNTGTKQEPVIEKWELYFDPSSTLKGRKHQPPQTPVDQINQTRENAELSRAKAIASIDQM